MKAAVVAHGGVAIRDVPKPTPGPEQVLERDAWLGLRQRLGLEPDAPLAGAHRAYEERMRHELSVIQKMGFAGYFLIVGDFIGYARKQGIPVGPGRGSSAGSVVAWSLGITGVDPIEYDIIFERFLNPERISMPDIDVDFCMRGRDEVIRYVAQRYDEEGEDGRRVSQIATFGTLQARAVDLPVLRDERVARDPFGAARAKLADELVLEDPADRRLLRDADHEDAPERAAGEVGALPLLDDRGRGAGHEQGGQRAGEETGEHRADHR